MSVRRWLAALFTLTVLTACSTGKQPDKTEMSESALARSQSKSQSQSQSPSQSRSAEQASTQEQAKAAAERQKGNFGIVVHDRQTGTVWKAGKTTATTWTASTIKLAIAADLLLRHRQGTIQLDAVDRDHLDQALISSDNDAATALWNRHDGAGMPARFRDRFGMSGLAVVDGHDVFWRHLRCSAEDLNALMRYVLDEMDAVDRTYIIDTLRNVGGNQRWGAWAAGPSSKPGNKNGWAQKPVNGRTVWVTHTVGFAGAGERFVVSVMYEQGAGGTLGKGTRAVSDVVAVYFGQPVPARITTP